MSGVKLFKMRLKRLKTMQNVNLFGTCQQEKPTLEECI